MPGPTAAGGAALGAWASAVGEHCWQSVGQRGSDTGWGRGGLSRCSHSTPRRTPFSRTALGPWVSSLCGAPRGSQDGQTPFTPGSAENRGEGALLGLSSTWRWWQGQPHIWIISLDVASFAPKEVRESRWAPISWGSNEGHPGMSLSALSASECRIPSETNQGTHQSPWRTAQGIPWCVQELNSISMSKILVKK